MFSSSSFTSSRISKAVSVFLCCVLLFSLPAPFSGGKAHAQSDKAVLKRQLPPDYALPKINDLLDEGKKLQRPDLPRPALKPSKLCGYHDRACKVKQAKEKKIGQNLKPSSDNYASQVAANTAQKSSHNWLSRAGRATAHALFNASPVGFANALTAEAGSFFASTPGSSASPINNAAPVSAATANAASASMLFTPPTYTSLEETKLDPRYRVGTAGEDLFSGNLNYSLPLVSLPGRAGLDVNITLSNNSLIWVKYNNRMQFDPGYYETLTPGFRLGFPEVEGPYGISTGSTCIVTLPSGKRVEMRQITTNQYQATDGSYLYLIINATDPSQMTLYATDGTQFKFELPSGGYQSRCTQIKDSNGNYITIAYKSIGDPEWPLVVTDKVTDTLGREIVFNYDVNLHLLSITQAWQGQTFTWAQFDYGEQAVNPNFGSLGIDGPRNNETIPVITRVITGDGARHTFVYNAWGQAEDFWLYGEADNARAALDYAFPAVTTAQSDCPRPTQRNDYVVNWAGATGNGWVSSTFSYDSTNETYGQMIDPSGVTHKEFFNTSNGKRGLTSRMETWYGGNIQKYSDVTWASDVTTGRPLRPRATDTQTCDDRNHDGIYSSGTDKLSRTAISYDTYASTVKLPGTVKQYNEGGQSVYRTAVTTYVSDANYTGTTRRIIGLPNMKKLYQGDSATLMAQTEYVYDSTLESGSNYAIAHTSVPSQHDVTYGTSFQYRGNLTKAKRYSVVSGSAGATIETRTNYHITGTVALAKDALDHQTSIFYDDSSSGGIAPASPTYAYPTKVTDPDSYSSAAKYNYDFGGVTETVDPKSYAVSPTSPPVKVVGTYDIKGRLDKSAVWKDGQEYSHTRYVYGSDHNYAETWTTVNSLSEETFAIHLLDGVSRERITISEHPGSVGGLKLQYLVFDKMGRVMERSNPTEVDGNWAVPVGGDDSGYIYSQQAYDWKGRPTITTNQDTTTQIIGYNGCGCAGSDEITIQDEGQVNLVPPNNTPTLQRRQQKVFRDVFGRVSKTQVLNWDASVYSTATTTYDARDQVVSLKQYQGPEAADGSCPSATCQEAWTNYDGYGRAYQQKRPVESNASTWVYNSDDTPNTLTDARGVVATWSYNNRHLATGISYTIPTGVAATSNVTFDYDESGNRKWMVETATPDYAGGRVDYSYNMLNQLQSETRQFTSPNRSYTISYGYNAAGQLASLTSPFNHTVSFNHDKTGRLTDASDTASGVTTPYTSQIKYRAWDALKSINYGNGLTQTRTHNARQLLTGFTINGRNAQYGAPDVMKAVYQYHPDGQPKLAEDQLDARFTRGWEYDHAGRLQVGYTGSEAVSWLNNQTPSGTPTGPYKQTYTYNPWQEMTERDGRYWSKTDYTSAQFINAHRQGLVYDNAGNIEADTLSTYYSYDAAGRNTKVENLVSGRKVTQSHDGDGQAIKRVESDPTGPHPWQRVYYTSYYLRSTALGGQVLAFLDQNGNLGSESFAVGGADEVLRYNGGVWWTHQKPLTGSKGISLGTTSYNGTEEPDSGGIDVGFSEPVGFPSDYDLDVPSYTGSEDNNPNAPKCYIDGITAPCSQALSLVSIGAASIDPRRTDRWAAERLGLLLLQGQDLKRDDPRLGPDTGTIPGEETIVVNSGSENNHWEVISRRFGAGFGLTGGQQRGGQKGGRQQGFDKYIAKLGPCVTKLFNVTLVDFSPSGKGHDGNFKGRGKDYKRGKGRVVDIVVENDATSYTTTGLDIFPGGPAAGKTPPAEYMYRPYPKAQPFLVSPYKNYTARNQNSINILGTQVHELGNSLNLITATYLPPNPVPGRGGDLDAGTYLERCVFGGIVEENGKISK